MYSIVEFASEGVSLRGRLYLPKNEIKKPPVVIMAHWFSATITFKYTFSTRKLR